MSCINKQEKNVWNAEGCLVPGSSLKTNFVKNTDVAKWKENRKEDLKMVQGFFITLESYNKRGLECRP